MSAPILIGSRTRYYTDYGNRSPQAQEVLALVCHYPMPSREGRHLVMLSTYIDDSSNTEMPVYVLAGFVSTLQKWAQFSDEWNDVLWMPPRIQYFSAREASSLTGEFAHWGEARRDERINLLIEVVNKYAETGIYSVIGHDLHERVCGQNCGPFSKFFVNFYTIIVALNSHYASRNDERKISFVFDEQIIKREVKESLDAVWSGAPATAKKSISWPPTDRDDKDVLPLQAADLFAWQIRRQFFDAYHAQPHNWRWRGWSNIEIFGTLWNEPTLIEFRDRILSESAS